MIFRCMTTSDLNTNARFWGAGASLAAGADNALRLTIPDRSLVASI
jgi:hypothetical protein